MGILSFWRAKKECQSFRELLEYLSDNSANHPKNRQRHPRRQAYQRRIGNTRSGSIRTMK